MRAWERGTGVAVVGAWLTMILTAALTGCSSSSSSEGAGEPASAGSPYANVDLANTRNAASSIEAADVSDLKPVWSLPLGGKGKWNGFVGSPVVDEGVVYVQDQDSNVLAIDLDSGRTLWEKRYETANSGPAGVIVAEGLVFGVTPTSAFALKAGSGKEVWSSRLVRSKSEAISMAPGYHRGRVYVSTAPYNEGGGEVGVLWALDARSGRKAWHFNTVPRDLWGNAEINFGGGLSEPPAFDGEGSLYIGTGNPGPIPGTERHPWGSSRPGPNLYTSSVVKLDEETGKVDWHYQVTPHSLCNWDVGAPLLTESDGRKMVLASGLAGTVVALDRETGSLLWERQVGMHNGHDEDGLIAMSGEDEKLKTPMTVYPGVFGGVAGSMAVDGSTVFVPVINSATRLNSQESAELVGAPGGELVALDLATGAIRWKKKFLTPLFGPVLTSNDLVFAVTFEGQVHAFSAESGEEIWSESLPSQAEGGLAASGDTLLVRAGYPEGGSVAKLVAYRVAG